LPATNIVGELGNADRIGLAQNVQVINVIGFEGSIGFEFAEPIALLGLQRKQMICTILDGLFERARQILLVPNRRYGRGRPIQSYACSRCQN
jgi:hypothetical protein